MPMKSEAQRRMMHAIAGGKRPKKKGGPSRAVAKRFVKEDQGGKLPKRACKKKRK